MKQCVYHVMQFNCFHVDVRMYVYIICVCTYIFVFELVLDVQ